jgi:hypothetical protein
MDLHNLRNRPGKAFTVYLVRHTVYLILRSIHTLARTHKGLGWGKGVSV